MVNAIKIDTAPEGYQREGDVSLAVTRSPQGAKVKNRRTLNRNELAIQISYFSYVPHIKLVFKNPDTNNGSREVKNTTFTF
jgi:hypothetical protein